ncbi:hypothetical protein Q8A67_015329 [Cirrhinus molitorella]|uniref:Uncharacterized protein n=1 Tax=Cirrhinus molitorella TaxID=172907 RepID=A0AA88PNM9_9TELE|nr:hypothetical protein Q8A67_015329 [Cirrhinus molitorella]
MGEAGSVKQVRTSRRLARHTAQGKTDNLALTDKLSSKGEEKHSSLTAVGHRGSSHQRFEAQPVRLRCQEEHLCGSADYQKLDGFIFSLHCFR